MTTGSTSSSFIGSRTAAQIPCCLCGTLILPNSANQCKTCLAQQIDLQGVLQKGPGGGSEPLMLHQCRQCRAFHVTDKIAKVMEPESPELLRLCLKKLPALQSHNHGLRVVDAMWIWTEPHSMRLKLRVTIRAIVEGVELQQRVPVEWKIHFKQCSECNREYSNRTWHALVQLRQKRTDDAPKKGLVALEMALARNAHIRKHVLKIDASRNGFDFYFLNLHEAQAFASYIARVAPMRIKTTRKLVSTDNHSNTANMKYTVTCDMVPLCRHDLVVVHKKAAGNKIAGRMALVTKVSSVVHLVDASPKRSYTRDGSFVAEVSPDTYYKSGGEKLYSLVQASNRLVRFVVLDVELCNTSNGGGGELSPVTNDGTDPGKNGTANNNIYNLPFALADVMVARESDLGNNDETFRCVTHLGNILQPGDICLGYDVASSVLSGGTDAWDADNVGCFQSSFEMPDIVLVKKAKNNVAAVDIDNVAEGEMQQPAEEDPAAATVAANGRLMKRKEKRRIRTEKKSKHLEESALRMGFVPTSMLMQDYYEEDPDLEEDLAAIEADLAAQEAANDNAEGQESPWEEIEPEDEIPMEIPVPEQTSENQ